MKKYSTAEQQHRPHLDPRNPKDTSTENRVIYLPDKLTFFEGPQKTGHAVLSYLPPTEEMQRVEHQVPIVQATPPQTYLFPGYIPGSKEPKEMLTDIYTTWVTYLHTQGIADTEIYRGLLPAEIFLAHEQRLRKPFFIELMTGDALPETDALTPLWVQWFLQTPEADLSLVDWFTWNCLSNRGFEDTDQGKAILRCLSVLAQKTFGYCLEILRLFMNLRTSQVCARIKQSFEAAPTLDKSNHQQPDRTSFDKKHQHLQQASRHQLQHQSRKGVYTKLLGN